MCDALAVVRRLEEAALAELATATGDASLCALARSGRSHPAAKLHEGASRALADVRRGLRRTPEADPATVLAQVTDRWLADQVAMASRGRDWRAYHAGGIDALERLGEELADLGSTPGLD